MEARKRHAAWVSEGVGMIDTGGYGADHTVASYVVIGDKSAALVDVGYSPTWGRVVEGLSELGVAKERIEFVFLTHVHLDHAGAAFEATKLLPNARLVVHERGIRHLIDPSRLVEATRAGFGDQAAFVGDMRSVQPERIAPAREEKYDLGGRSLEPIFTPGHMPGHMSLAADDGTVFTGDAVCVRKDGLGLIPAGSPPFYDVAAAVKSIERLEEEKPKCVLAPHFGKYPETGKGLEAHIEAIQGWKDRISAMVDEGLNLRQVSASMRDSLLGGSGLELSGLDDYSARVLLDKLLDMTVEGYMGYILAGKT